MALAEARAAWQRTLNRCFVQEDAKRAPKLACCSSSIKQADTTVFYVPCNLNANTSKWWLYVQPNHSMMDEQFTFVETTSSEVDGSLVGLSRSDKVDYPCTKKDSGVKEDELRTFSNWNCQDPQKVEVSVEPANKPYFDSKSSWIEVDKNTPWWRTADTDELASFVAQSSLDRIENCDLPRPRLLDQKLGVGSHHHYHTHQKLEKPSRDIPRKQSSEMDGSKAQLMEALRHSQTRAREAEKMAKEACEEKEHVVKLVFRQASQLFAYKQWLRLLQLETMNNTTQSVFLPKKIRIRKQCYPIVFALKLGLGLAGAGFLLGWTIGWMIRT